MKLIEPEHDERQPEGLVDDPSAGPRPVMAALRADWREIGGLGRLAAIGVVFAAIVTVILGFSITSSVRQNLLAARASLIEAAVADLPEYPLDRPATTAERAFFDAEVHRRVLRGPETIRVKLWTPEGLIVYSDASELEGAQFDLSAAAIEAFDGGRGTTISDLSDAAHELDREHGELIEYYVPLVDSAGAVVAVVEVEQDVTAFNAALSQVTRNVWLSIAVGLAVLGLFMAALMAARAREVNRRRRQAESLLRSAFRAQEEERRRVVGSLHDDIGQPLYRLHYGLEGARARLSAADPVAGELEGLQTVVGEIDKTLRRELRLLHHGLAEDAGLEMALADLVELTQRETGLTVTAHVDLSSDPAPVQRTALYRAAQEAITNVRKHANASNVSIRINTSGDRIVLEVDDDGGGVAGGMGLGLTTMQERFEALGGSTRLVARRTGGSRFSAWLPGADSGQA